MNNQVKRALEKMYDGHQNEISHENGTYEEVTDRNAKLPRVSSNLGTLPYRLLLHRSCIGCMVGKGGVTVKEIQASTGASVRFQKDGEGESMLTPEKVVTISGSTDQKNKALQLILEKILPIIRMQCGEGKETIIVVVPQKAVSMIIGVKGQRIQELSKSSGCEIQVQKEYNANMNERTVSVRSSEIPNLVSGVGSVYELLASLLETGKLSEMDFTSINYSSIGMPVGLGAQPSSHHMISAAPVYQGQPSVDVGVYNTQSTSNNLLLHPLANQITRSPTKLVVETESAAWIVGKSGAHIKDIKQQTGAEFVITECNPDDHPFTDKDRIFAIKGSISSKYNVIKLIVPAMEQKTWNAEKPLRFLISSKAVSYIIGHKGVVIKQLMRHSNANIQVENQDASEGERLVYVKGTPEAKTAAAIGLLQKLEEFENPDIVKEGLWLPLFDINMGGNVSMVQGYGMGSGMIYPSAQHMYNANSWGVEESSSEAHFIGQAQKYTNPRMLTTSNQCMIEIMLPKNQVDSLIHKGKMGSSPFLDIAQRSGCQVRLGIETSGMSRAVTLTGTPMANSIGLLLLQERIMQTRSNK